MVVIAIVRLGYEPTYNKGAPHCKYIYIYIYIELVSIGVINHVFYIVNLVHQS
jgi:hypothetical protein